MSTASYATKLINPHNVQFVTWEWRVKLYSFNWYRFSNVSCYAPLFLELNRQTVVSNIENISIDFVPIMECVIVSLIICYLYSKVTDFIHAFGCVPGKLWNMESNLVGSDVAW